MYENEYEILFDFSALKAAARAYRLADKIGMIGYHSFKACLRCGMQTPGYINLEHPEYVYCDWTGERLTMHQYDDSHPVWIDHSMTPLSCGDGQFFSSVDGGYPVIFYTDAGDSFCPACASDPTVAQLDEDDSPITMADVYMEGPSIYCDHCNKPIESAYGDPDNPEED